ncbi:MAG: ribonucleotide reductase N-terminal alpha domain-containing protein, partial [Nitrososphaeria archaeon]
MAVQLRVTKVVKRDGRVVDFDPSRIENAIKKAMVSVRKYDETTLHSVVLYVLRMIDERFGESGVYPHVEEIQDIVELALVKHGLYEVAKAYILYRKERENIRKEKMLLLERDYIDEVDKSLSLNAIRLLASRYLLRDENGKLIEGPKQMFQRVAALVVIPDILYDEKIFDKNGKQPIHAFEEFNPVMWKHKIGLGKNTSGYMITWNEYHLERMKSLYDELNTQGKMKVSWSQFWDMLLKGEFDKYYDNYLKYYNLMIEKKFLPNSPTLFNAGARLGQLSACFVLDINDDIESI